MKHFILFLVSLAVVIACLFTTSATTLVIAGLVFAIAVVVSVLVGACNIMSKKAEAPVEQASATKLIAEVLF